jgi:hypothetical protein
MIKSFKNYNKINESVELSGKYSFLNFLQVISNHDYHFILNDLYTKLYNYHMFFSTETIKDNNEFLEIFKYKNSLKYTYNTLQEIKGNKLSFFFGLKENILLRYGFVDLDTKRSYVVGEFNITNDYFKSISKYKAIKFINMTIQNLNVKNIALLSKIKSDFSKFYKDKKSRKIIIEDNKVINYFNRDNFTEDDLKMNRLFRFLNEWVSKKSWREKVEYNVIDDEDPIKFIIILK